MWLPMWVFDGNGFTMACLAVWIRNIALRWVFRNNGAVRSGGCDGIRSRRKADVRGLTSTGCQPCQPCQPYFFKVAATSYARSELPAVVLCRQRDPRSCLQVRFNPETRH